MWRQHSKVNCGKLVLLISSIKFMSNLRVANLLSTFCGTVVRLRLLLSILNPSCRWSMNNKMTNAITKTPKQFISDSEIMEIWHVYLTCSSASFRRKCEYMPLDIPESKQILLKSTPWVSAHLFVKQAARIRWYASNYIIYIYNICIYIPWSALTLSADWLTDLWYNHFIFIRYMLESKRDRNVIDDVTMTIPTAGRFLWRYETTDFHWIAATI